MTVTDVDPDPTPTTPQEPAPEAPILSQTLRRSGRKRTRVLAVLSLLVAVLATGYLVMNALGDPAPPAPLAAATDEAWERTGALSDALRALRPGASRNAARPLARDAAAAVAEAEKAVEALALPTSDTPLRGRVLRTLRVDEDWLDAVGSTLANPRSARRAELSRLAKTAAQATTLVAPDLGDARGTVGGTGRLLSATAPAA